MPGLDGAETVRRLRALGVTKASGCAIVGLTGDATPEETDAFTSAGLDALYFKPFTPRVFREIQVRTCMTLYCTAATHSLRVLFTTQFDF